MKKHRFIVLLAFFLFYQFFYGSYDSAHASENKLKYYAELLSDIGYEVKTFDYTQSSDSNVEYLFSPSFFIKESAIQPKLYYSLINTSTFLKMSSLEIEKFLSKERIIILCDSEYIGEYNVQCDEEDIYSSDLNLIHVEEPNSELDIKVAANINSKNSVLVISENDIIFPRNTKVLIPLIKSVIKSQTEVRTIDNSEETVLSSNKIRSVLISNYMEIFASLFTFFVLLLTIYIILDPYKIRKKLNPVMLWIHYTLMFLFFLGCFITILLLVFISITDKGFFDFRYIVTYVQNLFYLSENDLSLMGVLLLFIFALLSFIYFVIVLPYLSTSTRLLYKNLLEKKLNSPVLKVSFLFFVFFGILTSFYLPNKKSALLNTLILLFILVILSYEYLKNDYILKFELREKISLIFSTVIIFISIQFIPIKLPLYYTDLFAPKETFVLAPRVIKPLSNTLFRTFTTDPPSILIANNFVIYHPKYSKIINRNFDQFNTNENFVIVFKSAEEMVKSLLKHYNLVSLFMVEQGTSNYFISPNGFISGIKMTRVMIDCSVEISPSDISLVLHFTDSTGKYKKKSFDMSHFPGCVPGETSPNTEYYTDVDFVERAKDENIIFEIKGLPVGSYSFEIYSYKGLEEISNINVSLNSLIFSQNKFKSDVLYAYSSGSFNDVSFINDMKSKDFDVSVPINYLVTSGLLESKFLLWSGSYDFVVLKNDLFD